MLLVLLNIAGIGMGFWRMAHGPANELLTIWVSLVWVVYNMIILGGAVAVSVEARQIREAHRVEIAMPAALARADGHMLHAARLSDGGVGVELREPDALRENESVSLLLRADSRSSASRAVQRVFAAARYPPAPALHPPAHRIYSVHLCARRYRALWQDGFPEDKPVQSPADIMLLGFKGYLRLAEYGPAPLRRLFRGLTAGLHWLATLLPHNVRPRPATLNTDFT